jgi:hypothetical protein
MIFYNYIKAKLFKQLILALVALISFNCNRAYSQIQSVTTIQNLGFGAFTQGNSGGSVIISNDGSRSSTGSIVPLNLGVAYFQAIFEIQSTEGTIISILNGPNATLTGSNGGSMSLHLGASIPGSPFINTMVPPQKTQVSIGGTLIVGNLQESPAGTYSGTFYITFNNE